MSGSIQYLVFDFGQVLIHFLPDAITEAVAGREHLRELSDVLFSRDIWDRLDDGSITNEEATQMACRRLPAHLHGAAADIYREWVYHMPPVPGMWELIADLAAEGVPLYLLSNISVYFTEHIARFPVLSHFKKCFFSGPLKMAKPHKEIFLHLLADCGIPPEKTLFIDDNPDNLRGAASVGMATYLFDGDANRLRAYLAEHLTR